MSAQDPHREYPKSNVPTLAAATIISAVAALIYVPMVAGLASLTGSDAAGNAMSQGFTAIALGGLWLLLVILTLVAWTKGDMPLPLALAALVLVLASCIGAFFALELLSDPRTTPYFWPIALPAAAPPLIVTFCFWALAPLLRRRVTPALAGSATLGAIFLLCIALYPMSKLRGAAYELKASEQQAQESALAAVKPGAPMWEWTPFLDIRNLAERDKVIDTIRGLDRRQGDAEVMLARGDFPIGYLGRFDLDPTPAVCENAKALLRKRAAALMPDKPNTRKGIEIFEPLSDAVSALEWLTGYGCQSDDAITAWENTANAYIDPGFDTVRLRELHDPKELGRRLRERPEKFSMLTPQSHLKAWLSFAGDESLRDKALAGARGLDHRTPDAVEMLNDKYDMSAPWAVLKYMPVLDLATSPSLCAAALGQIRVDLTKVYRPRTDDPRPYSELLDRLGAYEPLTALVWLAVNGCDAEAELNDAEAAVRSYQDTRGRAQMLAQLASLHKKP